MVLGLLRVSWICLLLISSGACFPATKGDYRYPYTATWSSGGASGSNFESGSSRPPLLSLQPDADPQQPSSPTGNQFLPSAPAVSLLSYEPNSFIVSSAPEVPSPGAGYISPPTVSGKKAPSLSLQPLPVSGTSSTNTGTATSSSASAHPANTAGHNNRFGNGPALYANSPAAFGFGAGPVAYANAPAAFGFGAGPIAYANAPAAFGFGDGPAPYGSPPSAGGAHALFYALSSRMPSRPFPDFSAWESNIEAPQSVSETSPLPPSSYIIQSSNGYQRARELLAHTDYSPYYPPPPPPLPSKPLDAPSKSAPMTGSKGGKKAY